MAFAINDPGGETAYTAGRLNGMKTLVESADVVDTVLAVAVHGGARAIVAVPSDAVSVRPMGSGDDALRPFEVFVDGAPADILAAGRDAEDVLDRVFTWGHVMTAARALGVIEPDPRAVGGLREAARAIREADRIVPGGATPPRRHGSARRLESKRLFRRAVGARDGRTGYGAPSTRCEGVRLHAPFAALRKSGIQVHGGVGFTDEHDLHLLVKHALTLEGAWGDAGRHEDALADRLLQGIGIELTEAGRASVTAMESRPITAPVDEVLRPANPTVPHARTKDDHAVLTFGPKRADPARHARSGTVRVRCLTPA